MRCHKFEGQGYFKFASSLITPYTKALTAEKGNGEALERICRTNNLVPMNAWREQKGQEKDHIAWVSPDGKTKRQIDYVLVRDRHKNTVRAAGPIQSVRANRNQQRQHALIEMEIIWRGKKYKGVGEPEKVGTLLDYDLRRMRQQPEQMEEVIKEINELTAAQTEQKGSMEESCEKIWADI